MKKSLLLLLLIAWIAVVSSCQKELTNEQDNAAHGSLQDDSTGNCLPKTVAGIYKSGTALTTSNSIDVTLNITTAGVYNITTDTVNGYSFSASGEISATGLNTIKLIGSGTPLHNQADIFTIVFDTSFCHVEVVVADSVVHPASYSLQGAPGACMSDTVKGNYLKDTMLTAAEQVVVNIHVAVAGSYHIHTDTVNGYSFAGAGILTDTGYQSIILQGAGTPIAMQTNNFTVHADSTLCSFSITVTTPVFTTNPDHFPLTNNSYWTYNQSLTTGDTLKKVITSSATINGFVYQEAQELDNFGQTTIDHYRKTGNNYYEYGSVDKYTSSLSYVTPVNADILFLVEGMTKDTTWQTPEYTGNITGGQPVILQYNFACEAVDATETVNGTAYAHVYKIAMYPMVSAVGGPLSSTGEVYNLYYAKGVGLIYRKKTINLFPPSIMSLRHWVVN